jgi:hypothetical protein
VERLLQVPVPHFVRKVIRRKQHATYIQGAHIQFSIINNAPQVARIVA